MWRLILLAIVALGLAPGTWVRTPLKHSDFRDLLTIHPAQTEARKIGALDVLGVWELDSQNSHFGSYSALVSLGDGTLLAGSDRGRLLQFSPPGSGGSVIRFGSFAGASGCDKSEVDLESLTRNPATGTIWAGFEGSNAIARVTSGLIEQGRVEPEEMSGWSNNSGPESLVRLADGQFLVIAEGNRSGDGSGIPALLFPADPVAGGAKPLRFTFDAPKGFRAVDAAQLPDGRVLVLVRKVVIGLPPGFASAIVLADPSEIAAERAWSGKVIARFAHPLPSDNFEGLAVVRQTGAGGTGAILWMISDDNNGVLQRTLLYKLGVPAEL